MLYTLYRFFSAIVNAGNDGYGSAPFVQVVDNFLAPLSRRELLALRDGARAFADLVEQKAQSGVD